MEINADAAEKQEDRNVQNHVDAFNEPPHMELMKALEQVRSHPPALGRDPTVMSTGHEFAAPLLDKGACQDAHHRQEEADKEQDIRSNSPL